MLKQDDHDVQRTVKPKSTKLKMNQQLPDWVLNPGPDDNVSSDPPTVTTRLDCLEELFPGFKESTTASQIIPDGMVKPALARWDPVTNMASHFM
jgi:hypothetical protein